MRIKAQPAESVSVLVLSACDKTRASLLSICVGQQFKVIGASDFLEAVALFRRYAPPVVICNTHWRDFIEVTASALHQACVIVTHPFADDALWAEVLNLGGFDVLAQPLDATEVTRSIQAAVRRAGRSPHTHTDAA